MRLRSFLLGVNLLIFVLPLGGLAGVRLLDRQLSRQTHGELGVLGSALLASYREALLLRLPAETLKEYGNTTQLADPLHTPDGITSSLENAKRLPVAEEATPPELPADAIASTAGAAVCAQVQALREATRVGVRLVDFRGTVVCSSGSEAERSLSGRPEVMQALGGKVASVLRQRNTTHPSPALSSPSRDTGWRLFLALPVIAGGRVLGAVVVSRTPVSPLKALWQDRVPLATAALLLLGVVVLVSLLTQAVILGPMRRLITHAQRITRGEALDPGSGLSAIDNPVEMGQLAQALAKMAEALAARAQYVKTFATALSHELKTPLTSMRGAVELLQEHEATMTPNQRAAFLLQLAADVERMERLVRRTLEQVRTDVPTKRNQPSDLQAILKDLTLRQEKTTLHIELALGPEVILGAIGSEALEAIVSALLDNARQHARAGREFVTVQIRLSYESADHALIALEDDGPGIPTDSAERVFLPFYTTARDQGGTGLGLHLARALAEAQGGSLTLQPRLSTSHGALFHLVIPLR